VEARWSARGIPRREPDALVEAVGQQLNDAAAARLDVDLDRVSLRVAIEARLIPLIRRGVVHSRLRIREHRKRVLRRDGKLGEQPDN